MPRTNPWTKVRLALAFLTVVCVGVPLYRNVSSWMRDPNAVLVSTRDGISVDPEVLLVGTPKFNERVAGFKISLAEAKQIRRGPPPPAAEHWSVASAECVVLDGDWYVFSAPRSKEGVSLRGAYIHGVTGEAKWVWPGRGQVPFWENAHLLYEREIEF